MMIKKKTKNFLIILAIFVLIANFNYLDFSNITFASSIVGPVDSDLLLRSGSPTYMEGQNQPLTGNVVLMNFLVGAGNDVAAVGSKDEENVSISAVGKTANYLVRAKKVKSKTIIKLPSTSKRTLRNISIKPALSGTKNGYPIGMNMSQGEVQRSIVNKAILDAYNECKNSLKTEFAAFAWRPIEEQDSAGLPYLYHSLCINGIPIGNTCSGLFSPYWQPQIYFECYKFGTGSISYQQGWGPKTVDIQLDVQLQNNKNESSTILTLASGDCGNNCKVEGYFEDDGEVVGFAKITGWSPKNELPVDLGVEYPAQLGITGNRALVIGTEADDAWNELRELQLPPSYSWAEGGNLLNVQQKVSEYNQTYGRVRQGVRYKFNEKFDFWYNAALDSFIIDDSYTRNSELQVIVLGDWLGLIRDVANFEISCGSKVSGFEQSVITSSVTVSNVSDTRGTGTLLWSCPTGNGSRTVTLNGGSKETITIPFSLTHSGAGSCPFEFQWGDKKTRCSISYEFKERPEDCGNGVQDAGETCANCPQDVICPPGTYCDLEKKICVGLDFCGDGKIDPGEDCLNCPQDFKCPSGTVCIQHGSVGICEEPPPYLLYSIVILVVLIIILFFFINKKKKKKRKRRKK